MVIEDVLSKLFWDATEINKLFCNSYINKFYHLDKIFQV